VTVFRRPTAAERPEFLRTFLRAMNFGVVEDKLAQSSADVALDRSWVADEDGAIVGTSTLVPFRLAVPGADLPFAGLTEVAVATDHRRRGIMTELVRRFFTDGRDRGDVVAGLFASDAVLYRRYGFGVATRFASLTIESVLAQATRWPDDEGSVRAVPLDEAAEQVAAVFEQTRQQRPGELSRDAAHWTGALRRVAAASGDRTPWAALHLDAHGVCDGYAVYRIESKWVDHTGQNDVRVMEIVGSGAVSLALWRFLLSLDMSRTVTYPNARVDEPVVAVLPDPRRLRVTGVYDQLWLRLLDVAAALGGRRYDVDGELFIAVGDALLPDQQATYRLVVRDGNADCERVDRAVQLSVSTDLLATAYLGDRSWRWLADVGAVKVSDAAALAVADSMFAVGRLPQCLTLF